MFIFFRSIEDQNLKINRILIKRVIDCYLKITFIKKRQQLPEYLNSLAL